MKDIDKDLSQLYLDINKHLMDDTQPSVYLNSLLLDFRLSKWPFELLSQLKDTEQSPVHHPEGNVWNHTMLVVDQAASIKGSSTDGNALMWAALLHDIGKPATTKIRRGRITSYDHDKAGEKLSVKFLGVFTDDQEFIYKVSKLVRYHMHILYVVKDLPYGDITGMLNETDIDELALLGFCDRMGRTNSDKESEKEIINYFIKKCGLLERRYKVH